MVRLINRLRGFSKLQRIRRASMPLKFRGSVEREATPKRSGTMRVFGKMHDQRRRLATSLSLGNPGMATIARRV